MNFPGSKQTPRLSRNKHSETYSPQESDKNCKTNILEFRETEKERESSSAIIIWFIQYIISLDSY